MTMRNMKVCIQCRRSFNRISKPQWAFDAEINLMGRVHTMCAPTWNKKPGFSRQYAVSEDNPEYARHRAWLRTRPDDIPWREYVLFVSTPEERQRVLEWWTSPDHQQPMTPEAQRQLLTAVAALEAEYRQRFPEDLEK